MLRRLWLLCALAIFANPLAHGVGLGQLELESALNQEFSAEIELTNVRGLEPEEIRPGLASQEDFERVGIDRGYLLTDLRFDVIRNDAGNMAVKITSTRAIVEPYLNFLVEVLWPNGRILREYTVLLDPPVFGQGGVERISTPSTSQAAAPSSRPAQQQSTQPERREPEPPARTPSRRPTPVASMDEYGMTGPGDTLWAIALETRPDNSISVQQMMLALKRANPDAFINDNINLLKAGYVLRVPDAGDINRETFESAVARVEQDNQAFQSYRGGSNTTAAQRDASPRRTGSGDTSGASSQGELRLVASDDSAGERAGAGGASRQEVQQLENQLSVAEEDLDRARRNNNELNTRLTDLEDQIETLNEIVKLKDDQLAALRAEVQRLMSEQDTAPATPQPAPAPAGSLLSNPLVLGALALLVVIAAAGGLIFMRRRRAASDDDFEEEEFTAIAQSGVDADADEGLEEQEPALSLQEEDEDVSPQTSDVISEAEIYIAYGRFPQAITFLQNAVESEPDRADIQLKLLEVYVQTEDATAFNLQLEKLKALGDEDATAQALELQKQIPGAAETAEAAMDATVVSNEPVQAIDAPADDDDDDLSFDLDDLDSETEDDTLDLSDDVDLDDDSGSDDDDADFDLDLDLAADSTEDDDDGLDLDLDLDDDKEDDKDDDKTTASGDDELDLDLDLDDDATDDDSSDDDLDLDLDLDDSGSTDDDDDLLSLDDDDAGGDLDAELEQAASSGDGDALNLDDDDDGFELNLDDDDDDDALDLSDAAASDKNDTLKLDASDDDGLELDLDADDDDDDAFELNLDDDDDDDGFELNLDDDSDSSDDDGFELNLDDDDDDDAFSLDLDDDDGELNLDEDAGTKLDLARAYIEMDNKDDARPLLEEVAKEGDDAEKKQANELLEQI